jgi:hypothetical protein
LVISRKARTMKTASFQERCSHQANRAMARISTTGGSIRRRPVKLSIMKVRPSLIESKKPWPLTFRNSMSCFITSPSGSLWPVIQSSIGCPARF